MRIVNPQSKGRERGEEKEKGCGEELVMNLDLEFQLFMELGEGGLPCVWQPLWRPSQTLQTGGIMHLRCLAPLSQLALFPSSTVSILFIS